MGEGVTNVKVGDKCSVEPYMNCGECYPCKKGNSNCCTKLEVIGVISVVASLVFVGLQLQQAREISLTERLVASGEAETNLRDLIVENADLWYRGCANEELTPAERAAFNQIVFAFYFKNFMRHSIGLTTLRSANEDTFIGIMADNIHHFPGIRRAWSVLPLHLYTWIPAIDAEVARLDELQPEPWPVEACGLG